MLLILLFLVKQTISAPTLVVMYAKVTGNNYPVVYNDYDWEACMKECLKTDICVLATQNTTDVGCLIYTYYNVTTIEESADKTMKCAIKADMTECPSSPADPPLFGQPSVTNTVVNPRSQLSAPFNSWTYELTKAGTIITFTYRPCYDEEATVLVDGATQCVIPTNLETTQTDASGNCVSRSGKLVIPNSETYYNAIKAVSSGKSWWIGATLKTATCTGFTTPSTTTCGADNLYTPAPYSGTWNTANICTTDVKCQQCLIIGTAGYTDASCDGTAYAMCISSPYTVRDKTVILS